MDNDCETETDVLETAIKTVLDDLEYALKAQREEDRKKKSSYVYKSDSDLSADNSEFEYIDENSIPSKVVSNKEASNSNAAAGKKDNKKGSSV